MQIDVLNQVAAAIDVEKLAAVADAQNRLVARAKFVHDFALEFGARVGNQVQTGACERLLLIPTRWQIGAARQNHAVEALRRVPRIGRPLVQKQRLDFQTGGPTDGEVFLQAPLILLVRGRRRIGNGESDAFHKGKNKG